jgi:hypothetical protein
VAANLDQGLYDPIKGVHFVIPNDQLTGGLLSHFRLHVKLFLYVRVPPGLHGAKLPEPS